MQLVTLQVALFDVQWTPAARTQRPNILDTVLLMDGLLTDPTLQPNGRVRQDGCRQERIV
jgi:hypothetical protein